MLQYTLDDFEDIKKQKYTCILDASVHKIINDIASEVSNPE